MPQNKRILFPVELQQQARIAQTMSHPARINIMKLLNEQGFLICGEIVDLLPYSQAGVSHHLQMMLETNIIKRDEKFGAIGYQVDKDGLIKAKDLLQNLIYNI